MAMGLYDLFVTLGLDSSGYERDMAGAEAKTNSFASKLGGGLKTAAKVGAAGLVAAGSAVAALGVQAGKAYADFEQLSGGIETLYKSSGAIDTVMKNASNAFKTAGLSANQYMETVTGFSAALISSVGGDTEKAAKLADQAITDMADNANKMGSSLESIQTAYAGFSKGNFTMLDNLKLGYGGTKEEMERLLEDAEKLSGVKYDISSYADITEAIHVVQTEMGITGTTAEEAASTISGSLAMTKSAWENLVTSFALGGEDTEKAVDDLLDSVMAFGDNVMKVAPKIIDGIVTAAEKMIPKMVETIVEHLPEVIDAAMKIVTTLVKAIISNLPQIGKAGIEIIGTIVGALAGCINDLIDAGANLVAGLITGIKNKAKDLPGVAKEFITDKIKNFITGKQGFDEHSPSKWSASVGEYLMDGLAIGIKDGSGNVIKTTEDLLSRVKDRFSSLTTYWDTKMKGFDLDYKLWEQTAGRNADDKTKLIKQNETLIEQYKLQEKAVAAAEQVYQKMKDTYGETSQQAIAAANDLKQANVELKATGNQIMDNKAEISKLDAAATASNTAGSIVDFLVANGVQAVVNEKDSTEYRNKKAEQEAWEKILGDADGTGKIKNIDLVLPDGTKFATYLLDDLIKVASSNGTPIVNPA